jgi:ABC-2 type transport system permease protein
MVAGVFWLLWVAVSELREQISPAQLEATLTQPPGSERAIAFQATVKLWTFWAAAIACLIGSLYAFIQAMQQSAYALFDRGDLDLLVSSPVSPKVIFASRLIGVALRVFLNYCPIVVPLVLLAIGLGFPQLLGVLPTLASVTLITASLAMLLTLRLVRWFGARRARGVAQIFTAGLSAGLFLATQLPNLLGGSAVTPADWLQSWFGTEGYLGSESLLWFPVRSLFLDLPSVLGLLLLSGGLAWVTVEMLHQAFISGTQQAVTDKRQRSPRREMGFSGGFNQVVILKEWRIIWRNPYLVSATCLQVLFLIPALIIVLRGDAGAIASSRSPSSGDFSTFVTVTSIVIGESLTQTLTRICVSGEEAADLLRASPIAGTRLRGLKLLAALIPVWLLLSPLFLSLMLRGEAWLLPLLLFGLATTCAAVLRLWNSQPIRLADIGKRQQTTQGDFVLSLLELVALFTWACLGFVSRLGLLWLVLLPIGILILVVTIAYWRSQQIGSSLGF